MIRINHSGGMPFFQNDTSYNLPSLTGAVQRTNMEDKDPFKGYKVRWVQAYNLNRKITRRDMEAIARKMLAEMNEDQMLEDSGYVETKLSIILNHFKETS